MSRKDDERKNKKILSVFAAGATLALGTLTYALIDGKSVLRFKDALKAAKELNEDKNLNDTIEFSDYKDLKHELNDLVNKYSQLEKEYLKSNKKSYEGAVDLINQITKVRDDVIEKIYLESDYSRIIADNDYLDNDIKTDLKSLLDKLDNISSLTDQNSKDLTKLLNDFLVNNQVALERGLSRVDNLKNGLNELISRIQDNDTLSELKTKLEKAFADIPTDINRNNFLNVIKDLDTLYKESLKIIDDNDRETLRNRLTALSSSAGTLLVDKYLTDDEAKASLTSEKTDSDTLLEQKQPEIIDLRNKIEEITFAIETAKDAINKAKIKEAREKLTATIARAKEIHPRLVDFEAKSIITLALKKAQAVNDNQDSTADELNKTNEDLINDIQRAILLNQKNALSKQLREINKLLTEAKNNVEETVGIETLQEARDKLIDIIKKTEDDLKNNIIDDSDFKKATSAIKTVLDESKVSIDKFFNENNKENLKRTILRANRLKKEYEKYPDLANDLRELNNIISANPFNENDNDQTLISKNNNIKTVYDRLLAKLDKYKAKKELESIIAEAKKLKIDVDDASLDSKALQAEINKAQTNIDGKETAVLEADSDSLRAKINEFRLQLESSRVAKAKEKIAELRKKAEILLKDPTLDETLRKKLQSVYDLTNDLDGLASPQLNELANDLKAKSDAAEKDILTKKYNSVAKELRDKVELFKVDKKTVANLDKYQKDLESFLAANGGGA
ncbi:hypothetical protein [Mycoplasma struthionis]|uniref:Uncharacterized protein n=1 Tax=Mycoplasma struthionis TaxID=538220 RepID=A0A502M6V1_9MOLU|nr:hypothetical protein [Mycoplasma struthionis]TPI02960.1 hypothetical protein FJM01_00205 [Mycoplasma struthionis]